jgi:hypothetical protein
MANTLNVGNGDWATKENSLLGYNSENGNYKPLPFDFTRASNGTFVNKSGLIETAASGVPRIDFLGNTSGALLLEPQRSNISTRSNELNLWGAKVGVSITPNYSLSPDGSINSNRLLFSANGYCHNNNQQINGTVYTISAYVKRNTGTQNVGFFVNGSGAVNYAFDLTNEWQRFEYTYTSVNTSTFGFAGISGADISVYGFQLEVGSYATSLINTQGSAVTRVADVCSNGGNDQVINSSEGVLYAEISALADDSVERFVSLSNGSVFNRVSLWYYAATNGLAVAVYSGNVAQFFTTTVLANDTLNNKIAIKYKLNDFSLVINGVVIATDTNGNAPIELNKLSFNKGDGNLPFYGNVKDVRVYDTALTDAELIALTQV